MLNMTVVVGKKDVLQYGIKAVVIIVILFFLSKIVYSRNKNVNNLEIAGFIDKNKLVSCLEDNFQIMRQVNNKTKNEAHINLLKTIIESQFTLIGNIKEETEEIEVNNNTIITNDEKNEEQKVEQAQIGLTTEVIENNVPETYTNTYENVQIKNGTDYDLTEEVLNPGIEIHNKNVIIFHTHTCESYTPSEMYDYEETGTFRTTDLNYSVARVGTELDNQLTSYGFNVIHDETYHDYPAYNGSYGRSQETVENILNNDFSADIIIDIHRDAIGDYSYAPTVKIGEDYASQLMFVIGTDGGGLEHPNWQENLKFAIKVQEKANELYPGLFKPIILRNSRYNQQLGKGACIIEVGATGNTLEQSIMSMKYLAKIINEVVK